MPNDTGRQQLEQPPLDLEVILHVAMEVEVIAGEIGEDAGGKAESVGAAQRQGVRRDLDGAGAGAAIDHLPQQPLQIRGLRRRARRLGLMIADPRADGTDTPAHDPGRLEDGGDEIRGGCLAVRAGDPDQAQRVAGIAVEHRGQRRQRETRVVRPAATATRIPAAWCLRRRRARRRGRPRRARMPCRPRARLCRATKTAPRVTMRES